MINLNYIDPSHVINKSIFESIQDIAVCTICTGIVIEPRQCNQCENCFCKICIDSWHNKSSNCPFKCNDFYIREPTRVIKKILSRIVIECPKNCKSQVNYADIPNHFRNCKINLENCPLCGTQVSENLIKKESNCYIDLLVENKILRQRIEELELEKIEKKTKTTTKSQNFEKYSNKKIISITKLKTREINISESTYFHSSDSKLNYQFSCCNKSYDCTECHNSNENHSISKANMIICKICMKASNNINDILCNNCGICFNKPFPKEDNIKPNVIKYKNSKKNSKENVKNISKLSK